MVMAKERSSWARNSRSGSAELPLILLSRQARDLVSMVLSASGMLWDAGIGATNQSQLSEGIQPPISHG